MILLDTNVVSALMREPPDDPVVNWLDRQPSSSVWVTAITLYELHLGVQSLTTGKQQLRLASALDLFVEKIERRIAAFDEPAALEAGSLGANRRRLGRTRDVRDTMIAGIALARHATLATRNVKHFDDLSIEVINPWESR